MSKEKIPPLKKELPDPQKQVPAIDRLTDDKIIEILGKSKADNYALSTVLEAIRAEIVKSASDKTRQTTKDEDGEFQENVRRLIAAKGLENHYFLLEGINERHKPLALEFAKELTLEYDCKTASEKALVEIIASAYVRYLAHVNEFSGIGQLSFLSHEKLSYYAIHGKEADRAYRQYVGGLLTLRQLKAPRMELVVKAKTAFIAENQQVNTVTPSNAEAEIVKEEGQ